MIRRSDAEAKGGRRGRRRIVLCLAVLLAAGCEPEGQTSVLFLVRHAERAAEPADDPGLTPEGAERARELARLLGQAGITRIHSSDTRRTLETARPLAEASGVEIELYDPDDPAALAAELLGSEGRHLVVGHSNTIPELAEVLGGDGHGEIESAWEYDRLYILTPRAERVETILLRFGAPVEP